MKKLNLIFVFTFLIYGINFAQDSTPDFKKLNIKVGYASFNFADPSFLGDNSFFYLYTNSTTTGNYNGYRGLSGMDVKITYYLNNNLGLFTSAALTYKGADQYEDQVRYETNSDMNFIKLGVTGRIIGDDYPIRLNVGSGLALAMYNLSSSVINDSGAGIYLEGKGNYLGILANIELTVPIYKSIHFFSQFEYMYIPAGSLTMKHSGGEDYSQRYYDADLGGFMIKLGLGIDIF